MRRTVYVIMVICTLLTFSGCKKSDDSDAPETTVAPTTTTPPTTTNTDTETSTVTLETNSDFLLEATEETSPVIGAGTSLTEALHLTDSSPIYSGIYNMLRSWNPETDNGVVDMGNIYHVLDVAGDAYEQVVAASSATCDAGGACYMDCKPSFDAAFENSCIGENGTVSSATCDPLNAAFSNDCGSDCEMCYEKWAGAGGDSGDSAKCEAFASEKVVNSPFDFGENETYSCAVNRGSMGDAYPSGIAAGQSGTDGAIKKLLASFVWAGDGDEGEFNAIQGTYNESTKDLNLHFAQLVDHGDSHFGRRIRITGNVEDHSFVLRSLSGPKDVNEVGGSWVSIVGKGISQGTGNYFLLKIKSNQTGWESGKYLCFNANINKTELDALETAKPTGDATVDANCADFQTEVDALTFFEFATDMPHAVSDFSGKTSSSILLDY